MILIFDIGNTHIVTGVFDNSGKLLLNFRVASSENLTEDQIFSYLKNIADFNNISIKSVNGIAISSVVPNLTTILFFLSRKYFNINPIIVNSSLNLPIQFDVDNPAELGADRLANIVRAHNLYPENSKSVVIDFGTATTFDILQGNCYIGGSILPGIDLSIRALFKNTAKLPKVRFHRINSVIGKNTIEHINAGIYYGSIGQIKEILRKIEEEIGNFNLITTGGLGKIISKELNHKFEYMPDLTLNGILDIYNINKSSD
ncbi:type III pantothenate kinase [Haliovirga abyssi]|uniref:Type III pantothenate kinase n=1 Tax=Haliovirga abyssi TaxID=2996794 RepID=A0AAU9E334_9FUSO|nr:type III pantothenate kinase [Haliovirga abyssi]BDU50835.1 type III pantothenate kinase [Haliovirga abyssi]